MDQAQLLRRLMGTFVEELHEHVRAINEQLLALEKEPSPSAATERLQSLFRSAHSLKGAAHSVNVGVIEGACHRLEEILAAVRDGKLGLDRVLFGLLFESADALEEAGMRLREQHELAGSPLEGMLSRLDSAAAAASAGAAPAGPRPAPRPVEPPLAARPAPPPIDKEVGPAPASASVRVAAEKLNTLLTRVGELLVARRRIAARLDELGALRDQVDHWQGQWQRVEKELRPLFQTVSRRAAAALRQTGEQWRRLQRELERLGEGLAADGRLFAQVCGPLDEEVRQARLLPFAQACEGLERLVRDLAQSRGKEVDLVVEGADIEIDRSVLEGLKDPLRQLLRNAIDHGVETPQRRREAGKPARACVRIRAALHGSQVEVRVSDDGQGLDLGRFREQARRRGLAEPSDPRELARLIFLPGFSTAEKVTDISGRGIGLDIVKSRIEALHGSIEVDFDPGAGTTFTLTAPLTLTTLRAVLFEAAGQTYALAGTHVRKLARASRSELQSVLGRTVVASDGALIPVVDLATIVAPGRAAAERIDKLPLVIVAAGGQTVALIVDQLLAEQEVLIKALGARLRRLRYVVGATQLPSGRIALVLNAANIIRAAQRPGQAPLLTPGGAPAAPAAKRLLLVEDSITTRTLMQSILESAGYQVLTAPDGAAAWDTLQKTAVDAVISDVEMPKLDGIELTQLVRGAPRLRELPVVLVTSRERDEDRLRGIEAGANSYLIKSAFDQKALLETVGQLV